MIEQGETSEDNIKMSENEDLVNVFQILEKERKEHADYFEWSGAEMSKLKENIEQLEEEVIELKKEKKNSKAKAAEPDQELKKENEALKKEKQLLTDKLHDYATLISDWYGECIELASAKRA